jgi:hypothetical protein
MNWMIDGAYGDLYRQSMGYAPLTPAQDEWDIERRIGGSQREKQLKVAAPLGLLKALLASIAALTRHRINAPSTKLQITRK